MDDRCVCVEGKDGEVKWNQKKCVNIERMDYYCLRGEREGGGWRSKEGKADLDGSAHRDWDGFSKNLVPHKSGLEMIDAEMDAGHPVEAGGHMSPHARQRLSYQC